MLVALGNEYRARGVGTLFISADFREQRADALRFLVAQGVAMPGYVKEGRDQAFIAAVHPDWTGTLPATILLDANRRRRHFFEGEVSRSTLESAIAELLAEREEEEQ